MKYLVIGAGGTGGCIGAYLEKDGQDVTLIARGAHLAEIQANGLIIEGPEQIEIVPVKACTEQDYEETPDVIFVCVKGYSLDAIIPFLKRVATKETVIIPVLNIYGTGSQLQSQLEQPVVTDGCIYIASEIAKPGTLKLSGTIFKVVFGMRKDTPADIYEKIRPVLYQVKEDLEQAGIVAVLSDQIEKDAFVKFSFISPMAAVGASKETPAAGMHADGPWRDLFISLVEELKALSIAMDIALPENITEINLNIMDGLGADASASMQRDFCAGKASEVEGLVYRVVEMGKKYQLEMPFYQMIAEELKYKEKSRGECING